MDEIDDLFDADWNEAIDSFHVEESDDPEQNDENFQTALRDMVRTLQRRAYERGLVENDNDGVQVQASLDVGQSKELVKALLSGTPFTISLQTFDTTW